MTEDKEQAAFVQWFRQRYPSEAFALRVSMNGLTFPGRGKFGAIMWNKMKAQGLTKGEPDIIILIPAYGYRYLAIEHKALEQAHKLTDEQRDHLLYHASRGALAVETKGLDVLMDLVEDYMQCPDL